MQTLDQLDDLEKINNVCNLIIEFQPTPLDSKVVQAESIRSNYLDFTGESTVNGSLFSHSFVIFFIIPLLFIEDEREAFEEELLRKSFPRSISQEFFVQEIFLERAAA